MSHAIAFMRWERVVPWKILSLKAYGKKRLVPVGFGSSDGDFPMKLARGSRLWVVTKIKGQWSLAGLVAVRDVLDVNATPKRDWPTGIFDLCEKWQYVAKSDAELDHPTSEFFETNCATPVSEALIKEGLIKAKRGFGFTQRKTVCYLDHPLDEHFRECMEQGRKTVFLSYRWEEGREFALALAKEFREKKWSPWLDAMAIPDYMKKGDPGVNERRLKTLIKLGIKHSAMAVVINSWGYGSTPWTELEFKHICDSGKPWFQVMPSERQCNESTIFGTEPEVVVQKILEQQELRA